MAALRKRLDDEAAQPLYSDDDLIAALNDAVRQASIRKRLLLDRTTAECCIYAVAAGQAEVALSPAVLALRSVRWSGSDAPLTLTTLKVMDREQPCWPTDDQDCPTMVIVDAQTGSIVLYPTPAEAGTLTCAVWRMPLEAEEMEGGGDEPIIEAHWHRDLIDWAEHYCYLTKDSEAGDPARAEAAAQRFTAKFGRLPSAMEIRMWGLKHRSGQTAQLL